MSRPTTSPRRPRPSPISTASTRCNSCAGDVDLIAVLVVPDHETIADLVPQRISKVAGVVRTDTHIAFRSYSRRDTEDAFSIGM